MKGRTTREFSWKTELWPLVESWAAETGFVLKKQDGKRRIYRKGKRLLMAPIYLEISQERGKVMLETWVSADFYLLMSLLSGRKSESRIESGGLTAAVPRKRARDAVNRLLTRLGQAPIT